ncbi:MAG: methyltransferase domain-containing protein [Candidatus Acidiferrales bacterium]
MPDSAFRSLLKQFSQKSRARKFELFQTLFQPAPQDLVLDIGASGEVFLQYTFEDIYPFPDRIVGGGYDLREVTSARRHYTLPRYAVFDGCCLPFPDKSFDVVFSNAVIEHILGEGRQRRFAREVMRVGKSWFVTTPNYWYPFESHYHLPLIQFMPRGCRRKYNHLLGTHIPKGAIQELGLLSARRLQRLFPSSRIAKVRVTFWPETLVAYYVGSARPDLRYGKLAPPSRRSLD